MRLNLRAKVTLTVSLFLVIVFGIIMYLTLASNVDQLHSNLNQQSKSFAALATPPIGNTFALYKDSGSIKITQQVNKFLELDPDVSAVGIVSVDGQQLYSSKSGNGLAVSSSLASSFSAHYLKDSSGYIHEVIQPFFEDSGAHRYSIVYQISTKRIEQSVADAVRLILYVGIAIMVVSIVAASYALNKLFIRPLREVSHSADIISAGNYNQQIVTHAASQDEIGKLAQAVNKMANSLKSDIVKLRELDKMKSEFMMIASHNLRTPLTVMRGYIDMAESAQTVEQLKKVISGVQEGVVRLHLLAEDLLTISTLETGAEAMSKEPIDAAKFVAATVAEFELLAKQKKLAWHLDTNIPDGTKLDLNQANMRSALGNLVDNAIKFTDEGGSVHVRANLSGGWLELAVTDTGIGIAPEEVPKLFTKFHRATSTLTYDYEGVGIGLYLTKLIVERHGGKITAESQPGHGSTFTVCLPLSAAGPASALPAPAGHPPAA